MNLVIPISVMEIPCILMERMTKQNINFLVCSDQGTIVKAPRELYIRHCLSFEKKILVGFGLCLSDAQKKKVEEKIDEIMQVAMPWQTRYERIQNGTLSQEEPCNDAASELVKATEQRYTKSNQENLKPILPSIPTV